MLPDLKMLGFMYLCQCCLVSFVLVIKTNITYAKCCKQNWPICSVVYINSVILLQVKILMFPDSHRTL